MEIKDIFDETNKIGNEINRVNDYIKKLEEEYLKVTEICPHEIVFKYNDKLPKIMIIDGSYYCPACNQTIRIIKKEDLIDSPFKDSKIIPLTNLSLLGTPKTHAKIRDEVYSNIDYYYNPSINTDELSSKMESILEEEEYYYNHMKRVLKK